jgi:hypothetical protein
MPYHSTLSLIAAALQLMRHIQSLGILLGVARSAAAAQGQQLELLRKESLEGTCCCCCFCCSEF